MRVPSPASAGLARLIRRLQSSVSTAANHLGFARADMEPNPMNIAYTRPISPATGVVVPRDRLLRLPDVEAATGCKKSTI